MVSNQTDLKDALGRSDFARILGTPESTWIDFKKEPYRLDTFKGRWEYVKDVAALANANGGCVVVGVKTGRPANELTSIAESYAAIPKDSSIQATRRCPAERRVPGGLGGHAVLVSTRSRDWFGLAARRGSCPASA